MPKLLENKDVKFFNSLLKRMMIQGEYILYCEQLKQNNSVFSCKCDSRTLATSVVSK